MNAFAFDLLERAVTTFGETFCAALLLSLAGAPGLPSYSLVEKAAGAGLVAVLALLKGVCAGLLGNKQSAAALPAKVDPTAPTPPVTAPVTIDHNPVPPIPVATAEEVAGLFTTPAAKARRARHA